MFQGTIPQELRAIVREAASSWPREAGAWVGCSGNLTIERTLSGLLPLHSNDVSIYTSALGQYFTTGKVEMRLSPDYEDELDWLAPYLDGGEGTLAVMMLGTRFLGWVRRSEPYYARMVGAYRRQMPALVDRTKTTIRKNTLHLESYDAMDVRQWMRDVVPADGAFASFPPFYTGGYEAMFAPLARCFTWNEPTYPEIDEAGKREILDLAMDRPHWIVGVRERMEDLDRFLVGHVQTTHRAMPFYVYSSAAISRVVAPLQKTEPVMMPKFGTEDDIGDRLALHTITAAQFSGLRSQFMAKGIAPGAPPYSVAVSCDGKLIGAFAFEKNPYEPDGAYLFSDFPVTWTKYKRLAKLIVLAAMSSEAQRLMQRGLSRRVRMLATSAFSDNPNSAKYGRGIPGMRLTSRVPSKDSHSTWTLYYKGPVGAWTLAEALDLWKRKHAEARRDLANA